MGAYLMDLPTYIQNDNQENYNQELNQTLRDNLSNNGWVVPEITMANLAIISSQMPDGTLWYVTDSTPPIFVGKVNGSLVKFTTTSYP